MNNRHKYFRNLRYKQKLERKYDNYNRHVYFITEEPDPKKLRSLNNYPYLCKSYLDKFRGHDYYISWERPEVSYSIKQWHTENHYKTYCKRYANRIVRRAKKESQYNQYKKEFDLWWTID